MLTLHGSTKFLILVFMFLVLATECFFKFDNQKIHNVNFFWVVNSEDFGIYVSEICLFLCSSLIGFFVSQFFFFLRTVCG